MTESTATPSAPVEPRPSAVERGLPLRTHATVAPWAVDRAFIAGPDGGGLVVGSLALCLDTESFVEHDERTYRHSAQVGSHGGHGCCQDRRQARTRQGVWLGREPGRTLIGTAVHEVPAEVTLDGTIESWWTVKQAVAVPLRCRTNACPCCGPRLRRRRRARAFMGAVGKVAMVTLTIDPKDPRYQLVRAMDQGGGLVRIGQSRVRPSRASGRRVAPRDEELSTRYASWAWHRFRTYLAREVIERDGRRVVQRYGARAYFRGLELQRSGMAHLHVLVRVRDAADFLLLRALVRGPESDRAAGLAVRSGFGLVVDLQLARSGADVARYVSKGTGVRESGGDAVAYVSKGAVQVLPKHARAASWSTGELTAWAPGWVRPTPIAGFAWRVADASVSVVGPALLASGFELVDPERLRVPAGVP